MYGLFKSLRFKGRNRDSSAKLWLFLVPDSKKRSCSFQVLLCSEPRATEPQRELPEEGTGLINVEALSQDAVLAPLCFVSLEACGPPLEYGVYGDSTSATCEG